jgi:3-phenylpropionate/trans-cinnamate dioxygenase ferredoxin reductase component
VKVTVVEPQTRPLGAILDPSMADRIARFFADSGVRLRLGCGVNSIESRPATGDSVVVHLTDGSTLTSDQAVLALGAAPALDWLASSGVPIGDGVLCDAHLQAAESVFAAGDVANWHDSVTGHRTRIEHRTNAVEQAAVVAHNIVSRPGDELRYMPLPYAWSDQLGHRVQIFGRPRSNDEVFSADTDPAKPISIHCRDGHIAGVIGLDSGKEVRRFAQLVGQPASRARTDDSAPQEVKSR